jgi:hypothetical protein
MIKLANPESKKNLNILWSKKTMNDIIPTGENWMK